MDLRLYITPLSGVLLKPHVCLAVTLTQKLGHLHTGGAGGRIFSNPILGCEITELSPARSRVFGVIQQDQGTTTVITQARQIRLQLLHTRGHTQQTIIGVAPGVASADAIRSEERRVGKECRCRRWREQWR